MKSYFSAALFLILSLLSPLSALSQPLSPQAQAAYQGILKVAREAMETPGMTRAQFESKISAVMSGGDDDQKAARGGAMVMFDSVELVHAINKVEAKFDYSSIFDGNRYKSPEDIRKQQQLLKEVNKITSDTLAAANNSTTRLEEELRRAKVSDSRISIEISAARQRESETRELIAKSEKKLAAKISLNEARINALDFLHSSFGKWKYKEQFVFSMTADQEKFRQLMEKIALQEKSFSEQL